MHKGPLMADADDWMPVGKASVPGEVVLTLSRGPSQRQRHQEERRRHPALHPACCPPGWGRDGRGGDEAGGGERRGGETRGWRGRGGAEPEEVSGEEVLAKERRKKRVNEYEGQKAV